MECYKERDRKYIQWYRFHIAKSNNKIKTTWNIIKKERERKYIKWYRFHIAKSNNKIKINMEYYKERDRESTFSGTGSI